MVVAPERQRGEGLEFCGACGCWGDVMRKLATSRHARGSAPLNYAKLEERMISIRIDGLAVKIQPLTYDVFFLFLVRRSSRRKPRVPCHSSLSRAS